VTGTPDRPPIGKTLPGWVSELARDCPGYKFRTQLTYHGRSIVAEQVHDGTGPVVVVTPYEQEMRAALSDPRPGSPCDGHS
jgi:hypothetical protein